MNAIMAERLEPDDAIRRIEACLAAGEVRAALDGVNALLRAAPDLARAHGLLGEVALLLGQETVALPPLERALAGEDRFEHRLALATCLRRLGRVADAGAHLEHAARMVPPRADARMAMGAACEAFGLLEHACTFYAHAAELAPGNAATHDALGRVLLDVEQLERAVASGRRAVELAPGHAGYHVNLGAAWAASGDFEAARSAAETAIRLDPRRALAHGNLGQALQNLNRSREAVAAYEAALEHDPGNARFRFGLATALLKSGQHARGWVEHETRLQTHIRPRRDLRMPAWSGEALAGRSILVHGEQGLGDVLQFVRFVPELARRGGRVVLQVPRPLVRLLARLPGVAEAVDDTAPPPATDLHCLVGSLPAALAVACEGDIPALPYLEARATDDVAPGAWRRPQGKDLVVGLVWAGNPYPDNRLSARIDRRRSMDAACLAPLLAIPGLRFVSFQFGASGEQRGRIGAPLEDALAGVTDFAGTAVRLREIDLLVSVDTSIVHLAGALGVPVWMMSRADGCWRWEEARGDSPWYPSLRIFRQAVPGDWAGVVADVGGALEARVREGSRNREVVAVTT